MMLADMGAKVILVERKTSKKGDIAATDNAKHAIFNRGKQSIAIDLKHPQGIELVLNMISKADALIEGFRPGVMERLGLAPEVCLAKQPNLVYGRMTGWGQTGPLAQAAGHDPNYLGLSGALWYGGREQQPPTAPLTLAGDMGGGTMMLLWGVMCALLKAKDGGKGQVVDAAITDGSAYISSLLWAMFNTGQLHTNYGMSWADGGAPWNQSYECADGKFITLCSAEPQFYAELLERLQLQDNRLFTNQWDPRSWPEARMYLIQLFKDQSRQHWCDLLEGTDVCFGPVLDFKEATQHPHNVARGTFTQVDDVIQPSPAPKLSDYQPSLSSPPTRGEHSVSILTEIGFSEAEIADFKHTGIL
jgi:crotonobetainyl-CoA:carnitine CoA-transferase CaiB-like acyl-CoA transferase